MKKKVLLRAPVLTQSGYGVHGRLVLKALRKYEEYFEIFIEAINWGQTSWLWEDTEDRAWIDNVVNKTIHYVQERDKFDVFDVSVQCTIPNEFVTKYAPVNIGVTAGIEVDRIAPVWIEKSNTMNKVIVVSNFSKEGFDKTSYQAQNKTTGEVLPDFRCSVPVSVINYPVNYIEPLQEDIDKFKFETDFNFLCISQWGIRKNIDHTILWFLEEFKDREDVGLIVKTSVRNNSVMDRLDTEKKIQRILNIFPNRKCKVYLLHGFMNEKEMSALYNHPSLKALISLSHGEGYGLSLFESAYYGLPIITTAWSGVLDFLTIEQKNKKTGEIEKKNLFADVDFKLSPIQKEAIWDGVLQEGSVWAYPDKNHARKRMREMYFEHPRFKQQAKRLQKHLLESEHFSEETILKKYAEEILGEEIKEVAVKDLPKVSLITSVFRAAEYLEGYFKDVMNQSIFKDKIEVVLVHPKNSPEYEVEKQIIDKYISLSPENFKYVSPEEDKGLYACWNEGIRNSTGELISNFNCDDRRHRIAVEKCAKELLLDEKIAGVYYDQYITNGPNQTFEKNSSGGKKYNFPQFSFNSLKLFSFIHAMPVWRRSLHDKYGWFEEKYKFAGDWNWFLHVCSKGEIFKKIDDILGLYYFSPRGLSTDVSRFKEKRVEEKEVYNRFRDMIVEEKK